MRAYSAAAVGLRATQNSIRAAQVEPRWTLAFVGILFYLVVEYTRLPAMYPSLSVLRLGKVAIALAALGYLVAPRLRAGYRPATGSMDLAMFFFILGNFVSACFVPQQEQVWLGFLDVLAWGVIYFLITRVLTHPWQLRVAVFLLLLLNLKLAQFAIRGHFHQRGIGMSAMEIYMRGGGGAGSTGFFGNAGDFGVAMGVVWAIAWALLFRKTEKKLLRAFLIICFTLFLLAILVCGSRGAVVGAAAIVLAAFARTPKKLGAFALALLFLLCIWFVLPEDYKERFRSASDWENDPNTFSRIMFWKAGVQMFEDHPILGVGPGSFPQAYATSYANLSTPGPPVAHSIYIQVLAESGLVGTISLLALLVLLLRLNARTRRHALASSPAGRQSFEYCLALGLDLALVGYLTSGAFLSVLYYPHLWILLGLSVAANTACLNKQPEDQAAAIQSRERNFGQMAS